jgi:hypothetical protein
VWAHHEFPRAEAILSCADEQEQNQKGRMVRGNRRPISKADEQLVFMYEPTLAAADKELLLPRDVIP